VNKIPEGISQQHILAAIRDFDAGLPHSFGESTGYDVLYENRRYPPKALVGLAAGKILGTPVGPQALAQFYHYQWRGVLAQESQVPILTDLIVCFHLKGYGFSSLNLVKAGIRLLVIVQ
jgi:hypothetical protein